MELKSGIVLQWENLAMLIISDVVTSNQEQISMYSIFFYNSE